MNYCSKLLSKWFHGACENTDWVIQEMDVTQWGIVAALFVVVGFVALRTRM